MPILNRSVAVSGGACLFFVLSAIAAFGQRGEKSVAGPSIAIVNFTYEKSEVYEGKPAVDAVKLTMRNLTDQELTLNPGDNFDVHVYNNRMEEAATTRITRQSRHHLRPDDVPMREDRMFVFTIPPKGTLETGRSVLRDLYDISAPGKYFVYAEVLDPVLHQWIRTKTLTFEVAAPLK